MFHEESSMGKKKKCRDVGLGTPDMPCGLVCLSCIQGDVCENLPKVRKVIKKECRKAGYSRILCSAMGSEMFTEMVGAVCSHDDPEMTPDLCHELRELVATHFCHQRTQKRARDIWRRRSADSALAQRSTDAAEEGSKSLEDSIGAKSCI